MTFREFQQSPSRGRLLAVTLSPAGTFATGPVDIGPFAFFPLAAGFDFGTGGPAGPLSDPPIFVEAAFSPSVSFGVFSEGTGSKAYCAKSAPAFPNTSSASRST